MSAPGRRTAPTLAAVAAACGVSLSTASKALNPHADRCDVGAATRERILAAAVAMGYERDASRSARARRRYGVVGLVWPRHASRGIYTQFIESLAEALRGLSYRLLLTPVEEAEDWGFLQQVQRLDGVVVAERAPEAVLADLERRDWPAVLVNLRTSRRLAQVLVDERAGIDVLVRRLAADGHRRIAYATSLAAAGHYSEEERAAALAAACAAHGMVLSSWAGGGLAALAAACRGVDGPSAVVTYQHRTVPPLLQHLAAAGVAVPARVAVASLDDMPWLEHLTPPVAAVALPVEAMARQAAVLVTARIESGRPSAAAVHRFPGALVERASLGGRCGGAP